MKPAPFEYYAPVEVGEAINLLAAAGPEAKVLAGGQSLVPLMNLRLAKPTALIDLNRVGDLRGVDAEDGWVTVGAMTRHREVAESPILRKHCPLVSDAASQIGYPAIRNRGTLGGTLAHADPASEMPAVAVTLQAELVLRSPRGERRVAAADFFISHFTTALEPDEILTEIRFPSSPPGSGWDFQEFSRKVGDFAVVAVAVHIVAAGGSAVKLRVGMAGVGERPVEVPTDSFEGRLTGPQLNTEVAEAAAEAVSAPSDIHGGLHFRQKLARVLTQRAMERASRRAEEA